MIILKKFLTKNKAMKLEKFLIKNEVYPSDLFNYAKDMTLKEFYHNCQCSEQIIWLFSKTNPSDIKQLVLTAAHCANACRHLLKDTSTRSFKVDERPLKAIDAALNFKSYSKEELEKIRVAAWDAWTEDAAWHRSSGDPAFGAAANLAEAAEAAVAYYDARAALAAAANLAEHVACYAYRIAWNAADALNDKKLIADIVRKHLPLKLWNQEIINKS